MPFSSRTTTAVSTTTITIKISMLDCHGRRESNQLCYNASIYWFRTINQDCSLRSIKISIKRRVVLQMDISMKRNKYCMIHRTIWRDIFWYINIKIPIYNNHFIDIMPYIRFLHDLLISLIIPCIIIIGLLIFRLK